MFPEVPKNESFSQRELAIEEFWKEQQIYQKTLTARDGAESFVFFEGPPTANGLPHPGHCLTRAIKDLYPRYRTMRGFRCERKAGWDTHGLPVEVEVCKELGIHSKEEIEEFGVEPFIQKCQQSVWRYMQEWERLTERLGFWVNLEDAYVTYHQSYVESVWWSLKNRCSTEGCFTRDTRSSGGGPKVARRSLQRRSRPGLSRGGRPQRVYVKFPVLDDSGKATDTSLAGVDHHALDPAFSNQFAAVHPEHGVRRRSVDPEDGKPS